MSIQKKQYSLNFVFLTITVLSIIFSQVKKRLDYARLQAHSIQIVQSHKGFTVYDFEKEKYLIDGNYSEPESLLISIFGFDYFYNVQSIYVEDEEDTPAKLSNEELEQLCKLWNLKTLYLHRLGEITDSGYNSIQNLENLETLHISDTSQLESVFFLAKCKNLKSISLANVPVNDQALSIFNALPNLESVSLINTNISKKSASEFEINNKDIDFYFSID